MQRFRQSENQSVDEFYTRCKAKVLKFKFKDNSAEEERMIEVLISGIKYSQLQKKLLTKDDKLDLKSALDICRTQEATVTHMAQLHNLYQPTETSVSVVKSTPQLDIYVSIVALVMRPKHVLLTKRIVHYVENVGTGEINVTLEWIVKSNVNVNHKDHMIRTKYIVIMFIVCHMIVKQKNMWKA